jgi:hypothetical protein
MALLHGAYAERGAFTLEVTASRGVLTGSVTRHAPCHTVRLLQRTRLRSPLDSVPLSRCETGSSQPVLVAIGASSWREGDLMKIDGVPFGVTDWATVPETIHPGASGVVRSRTVEVGNVRIRMVAYPKAVENGIGPTAL